MHGGEDARWCFCCFLMLFSLAMGTRRARLLLRRKSSLQPIALYSVSTLSIQLHGSYALKEESDEHAYGAIYWADTADVAASWGEVGYQVARGVDVPDNGVAARGLRFTFCSAHDSSWWWVSVQW